MSIIAFVILGLLLSSTSVVYAQQTRNIESITIPFTSANSELMSPDHYAFTSKHIANWILTIENKLQYNEQNSEAKVVLRLKENPEDTNFVEIAMLSPPSYRLWLAVSNDEVGYMRMYQSRDAWFPDRAVTASYVQNDRLTLNNGQRAVVDRLGIGPFALGTIEVYGRDGADAEASAFAGEIKLEVMSGNPLDNPIMIIPFVVAAATGGVIVTLLIRKKR